jgi:hypothetical protein
VDATAESAERTADTATFPIAGYDEMTGEKIPERLAVLADEQVRRRLSPRLSGMEASGSAKEPRVKGEGPVRKIPIGIPMPSEEFRRVLWPLTG